MADLKTEILAIQNALDVLLTQMLEAREGRSAKQVQVIAKRELELISAADFHGKDVPTREQSAVNLIVKYPVEGACRYAVVLLGRRLAELVANDYATMLEVSDQVAERDPKREGRRKSILNSAWDGIGFWHA